MDFEESTLMEGNLVIVEEESGGEEDLDGEPVYSILDEQIQDKARLTLPKMLCIAPLAGEANLAGVFATCSIPYRTQFGPLDAPLALAYSLPPSTFLLKSKVKCAEVGEFGQENYFYYNTSDEKLCNWMSLVRPARNFEEQNLIVHLVKDQLYFTTTRFIAINEELKVWYAPKYATFVGKKVWLPTVSQEPFDKRFTNNRARSKPTISPGYEYYEGDHGVDVRSVPPKKRGWKRASQQINKMNEKPDEFPVTSFEAERSKLDQANQLVFAEELQILPPQITETDVITSNSLQEPKNRRCTTVTNNARHNLVFPCPDCGKVFYKKYTLKIHRTTHSTSCNFLCHACGKGFKRSDKLKQHIKKVHDLQKVRKRPNSNVRRFVPSLHPKSFDKFLYKCLKCSLGFVRRGMFLNHMLKQHPELDIKTIPELSIPIFKDDVSFSCLYCDKLYKTNAKRKRHIEKHHPGQPIPPDYRKSKNRNEGVASKGYVAVKPIQCPHCPSQYTTRSKMRRHVQSKHKDISITLTKQKDIAAKSVQSNSTPSTENYITINSITNTSYKESTPFANGAVPNPPMNPQNSADYNTVDNMTTFWSPSHNSPYQTSSLLPTLSTSHTQCNFVNGSTQIQPATNHDLTNSENASNFSSQIQGYPTSQSTDLQFVQSSTSATSQIQNDKVSTAQETFQAPCTTSYIRDTSSHQFVLPNNQNEANKTMSNTGDQIHRRQDLNFHKSFQHLPLTYARGRKQLLLPFCTNRLNKHSSYNSSNHMYPTSSNANEKQANLHRTDELNHASSHQHSGVNESRYTTLSVATPTTQPTYLQTTSIPSLPYQDQNWMFS